MHTIEIQNEALPIVKSGLTIEKKRLDYNYKKFTLQLKMFENKHLMSSSQFIKKFNKGTLGDDEQWFDWLFAIKAQKHLKSKLALLNSIRL